MSCKIVFVLSLVSFIIILNIIPVIALDVNITDEPEIIHISSPESFVRLTLSDGIYLVMSEYQPGIDEYGVVYLYDISKEAISVVPMADSYSKAIVANKTVFFRYTDGFYSYHPPSGVLKKLNVPIQPILTGFVTDGIHFITMWGDYWPRDLTFMMYDLQTGEQSQIYPGGYPDPSGPMFLSGDYFVYDDSGMLVADPDKRYLHAYNISSGETITLPKEDGYSQYLANVWGNTIVYELFSLLNNAYPDPPQYRMFNLKSMEATSLLLPDGIHPSQVYPPYALQSEWDQETGVTTVKLVRVDLPPIVHPTTESLVIEQNPAPPTTPAGSSIVLILGLTAFILAGVLTIFWRKK